MNSIRTPQLGDMMIVSPHVTDRKYVCVVSKVEQNAFGHSDTVFVTWQGDTPPGYLPSYGYSGKNIVHSRNQFRIFRGAKEIK